ncbi:uncharacterized protein RCO7_11564 [Rhynchosporium graminicola]|uniref:Uncharacterized protein n=1 Tax=Rhynchosporium graminicola TaxID=2792576 RepID=A0A1E1L2T5_9HELO|nr:uncharacterized protein RCO7_11564 [Rhynchosporium commune]
MPVLVRYYTGSDTSSAGIPINSGPIIYPSSHMIFSTALVVASKSGVPLLVPASTLSAAYYIYCLRYVRAFLKIKYNNTPILELLCSFNKPNSKLYKYYSALKSGYKYISYLNINLLDYVNTKYTILSGLLLSSKAKDAELNRKKVFKELEFIKTKELNSIIQEFAKKAIFKAIISNTKGKRNLPSSLEIASDLDTSGPSLKKKAHRISYYTRSTAKAALADLGKELDIVIPVLDIPDLLEAPEDLGEKANKVEVVKEVEF